MDASGDQRRASDLPGTGVTDGCEPLWRCWEVNILHLQEQVLFTTKPSLQRFVSVLQRFPTTLSLAQEGIGENTKGPVTVHQSPSLEMVAPGEAQERLYQ